MASENLRFALDKYNANKLRENWINEFSRACGYIINDKSFIDLDFTKNLRMEFFTKVKNYSSTVHNFWLSSQQNCLIEYLDNLASILVDQQVILFHSQDKFFGAVRIPAVAVFHNIMAVWEIVKEDIAMVTEDNNNGICIEKSYYDRSGNYYADGIYEFSRWGLFKDM